MFRQFAGIITEGANGLFLQHATVLTTLLEVGWQFRVHDPDRPLGDPGHRSNSPELPQSWLDPLRQAAGIVPPVGSSGIQGTTFASALAASKQTVFWDHLIYAYMIENTRIYEIFRRVLHEFVHGETLGVHS